MRMKQIVVNKCVLKCIKNVKRIDIMGNRNSGSNTCTNANGPQTG